MFEYITEAGKRFKEERMRLCLTTTKVSEILSVPESIIIKYEDKNKILTNDHLRSLEQVGFDIPYLILAIEKENLPKEYSECSLEIYREVAREVDLLDMRLGGNLDNKRMDATLDLLNYFKLNPQEVGLTNKQKFIRWVSKFFKKSE